MRFNIKESDEEPIHWEQVIRARRWADGGKLRTQMLDLDGFGKMVDVTITNGGYPWRLHFRWACMQLHFAARPQQTFAAPADLFGDLRLEVRFLQPCEVQKTEWTSADLRGGRSYLGFGAEVAPKAEGVFFNFRFILPGECDMQCLCFFKHMIAVISHAGSSCCFLHLLKPVPFWRLQRQSESSKQANSHPASSFRLNSWLRSFWHSTGDPNRCIAWLNIPNEVAGSIGRCYQLKVALLRSI